MEQNYLVRFHVSPYAPRFHDAYIPKKYVDDTINFCCLLRKINLLTHLDSLNLKMIAEVYEVFFFSVLVLFLLPKRTRKAGTQPKLKYSIISNHRRPPFIKAVFISIYLCSGSVMIFSSLISS